jgi:hypothetical protein
VSGRWFHRGKEACAKGKPRELKDARISRENRSRFFDGWDEQARMVREPTAEERAEASRVVGKLKEFARTSL